MSVLRGYKLCISAASHLRCEVPLLGFRLNYTSLSQMCCGTVQTTVLLGFIRDYASGHQNYSATLPPDKELGYRAVVDPFSVLGSRAMGTVWAMKALSVAGAELQFSQSITFHSLLPFLSFFFPLTLTSSL